nr:MAG TPA: hypothetical protein [Caudoviricetes sp.]
MHNSNNIYYICMCYFGVFCPVIILTVWNKLN